jgi:hypothetical protein
MKKLIIIALLFVYMPLIGQPTKEEDELFECTVYIINTMNQYKLHDYEFHYNQISESISWRTKDFKTLWGHFSLYKVSDFKVTYSKALHKIFIDINSTNKDIYNDPSMNGDKHYTNKVTFSMDVDFMHNKEVNRFKKTFKRAMELSSHERVKRNFGFE